MSSLDSTDTTVITGFDIGPTNAGVGVDTGVGGSGGGDFNSVADLPKYDKNNPESPESLGAMAYWGNGGYGQQSFHRPGPGDPGVNGPPPPPDPNFAIVDAFGQTNASVNAGIADANATRAKLDGGNPFTLRSSDYTAASNPTYGLPGVPPVSSFPDFSKILGSVNLITGAVIAVAAVVLVVYLVHEFHRRPS